MLIDNIDKMSRRITIDNSNYMNNISYTVGTIVDKYDSSVEFIEFGFKLLGIDLTYDQFILMSSEEKKLFLRDKKLEKLLK